MAGRHSRDSMRRSEIVEALRDAIRDHVPDDVARVFEGEDLDQVANHIQTMFEPADAQDVSNIIRAVVGYLSGRDLDAIADGEIPDPAEWFVGRIR